tara:strand:+ start:1047 stop:1592 length:546 start_codon:yes stop_codon:yes gene_type:complete
LWLSQSNVAYPINKDRLIVAIGFSGVNKSNFIPNLYNTLKISKNLSITSKVYTFNYNKESPQVIGVGFQYYQGKNDSLNWVLCFQKADLKGLSDYRLSTITLNAFRRLSFRNFEVFYGFGSNFYKRRLYVIYENTFQMKEDQINYLDISLLTKVSHLNININLLSNFENNVISLMFQKNIF